MIWHLWYRRRGTETWSHRTYRDERRARRMAGWLTALGHETQLQQGSWSD